MASNTDSDSNDQGNREERERAERIRQVIDDCFSRRAEGEAVPDDSLLEAHPDLLPELTDELRYLHIIASAKHQADVTHAVGLHIRCPHCHHPVEIVEETELTEVVCASCGSNFSLLCKGTEETTAAAPKSLGRFLLLEKLGTGACGSVWKAHDTQLERIVAVKIPRHSQLESDELKRFVREARSAASLSHPNIVSVHEVGRQDDQVYIVSDFVEGTDLGRWLENQHAAPREAAELCLKLAEALQHAHERGIIHRDLKPSNIMLDGDGQPQLMDFGLAKRDAGEMTMTVEGRLLGTPAYMSPEQARGEAHGADRRTDVYSLGVVLFELLTGERPFRGSPGMLLQQVLSEEPPSPRRLNHSIPRDLENICLKCLEKNRDKRYASTRKLAEDLRRFLGSEAVHARPISRATRVWRLCKRKPMAACLVGLLLFLAVAGPVVSFQQYQLRKHLAKAEQVAKERLWRSLLEQASANRAAGRRAAGLNAVRQAVEFSSEIDVYDEDWLRLRNEAIGCMSVVAESPTIRWRQRHLDSQAWWVDHDFVSSRYARADDKSGQGTLWIRSAHDGRRLFQLPGPGIPLERPRFSPSGRYLAVSYRDGQRGLCRVWDLKQPGQPTVVIETEAKPRWACFVAGDRYVVLTKPEGQVCVFDLAKECGERALSVPYSPQLLAGCSSNACVAVVHDRTVDLWDILADRRIRRVEAPSMIQYAAIDADGKTLAVGCHDRVAYVWQPHLDDPLELKGHRSDVVHVAFQPNGPVIATSSWDGTTRLWEASSGRPLVVNDGRVVRFSPDGGRLAFSTSHDVGVWDISTGREYKTIRDPQPNVDGPFECSFDPSGQWLATADPQGVRIRRVATGQIVKTLELGLTRSVVFDRSGNLITSSERGVERRKMERSENGQTVTVGRAEELREKNDYHHCYMRLSDDGRYVAVATGDRVVEVISTDGSTERKLLQGHFRAINLALSRDARWAVTGTWKGAGGVWVWDVRNERKVCDLCPGAADAGVTFSPDGKFLLTSTQFEHRCWKVGSWDREKWSLPCTCGGMVATPVFSPDSKTALLLVSWRTRQLVSVATGNELATLPLDEAIAGCPRFNRGGSLLAISGGEAVYLWDLGRIRKQLAKLTLDWEPMVPGKHASPIP